MRKVLSLFLAFVFVVGICASAPITANAASVDDLTFEINEDGQSYYVADCSGDALGEMVIPSTYNGLPVTSIGDWAFSECCELTGVTISDSVTSIGEGAFFDCSSLASITIPDSVTSIGDSTFQYCTFLTSITIPDSVTSIGEYAFAWCDSIISITIPDSVTSIGDHAFYYCTSLTSITIPDSVTSIGDDAFCVCTSLTSVTIPDSVTSIGDWAFCGCTSLTSVTIPDSVTSIDDGTFSGCTSLTSITIPNSVTSIGYSAFEDCSSLKSITIPDSVTSIGWDAFYNCTSLTIILIPDSVTSIGDHAFYYCTSLTSITIPDSVTSIGDEALGYYYDVETNKKCIIPGFTITGKSGSAAEKYAKENGIKFVTEQNLSLTTPVVKIANTAKGIKVTWNKIANAEKYVVYQRTYNAKTKKWSGWKALKTTTGISFVDTTTKLGTIYRYTVKAVNGKNTSGIKSTSNIKFDVKPTVTVANASNGIKVSWSTVANATGYTVYSSTYNSKTKKWSGWKNRGTAKANAKSWVDKSTKKGTIYKYTVRARYGSVASSFKASANIVRLLNPTVKVAKASNGIKVTWNKIAGAKNYKIYRAQYVNGKWSGWSAIKTTNNKTFAYVDKTAKKGVYYKYTVRAVNGKSASAFTASKNVKR